MIKNRAVPSIFGNQGGDWKAKRRSEALAMFEAIEFGSMPHSGFQTLFSQAGPCVRVLDGKAERFVIRMDIVVEGDAYTIPFTLLRPLGSERGKCPVNLFLYAYENNAAGYNMEPINIQDEFTRDYWPVRLLLEKGYAAAAFYVKDAESDNAETFPSGLVRFFQKHKTTAACTGKCIAAWAFAGRQIINYLYACDWIDTSQITVAGHSRCGKAALWCGAVDERVACTFANNSGCSGASLARGTSGERIDQITSTFPHWFCSAYAAYAHREAELPFDQHVLLGLIAPRRLYVTSASLDAWANPDGEFLSCVYAGQAFQQYDLLGLETDEKPRPGVFLHAGHIGYHIREGNHDLTLFDWQAFITYFDQHRRT